MNKEEAIKKEEDKKINYFRVEDFVLTNPNMIITELLQWLSERQGQKRFSKDPDVIAINNKGNYSYEASKRLHSILDKYNFTSELFTKTEEQLSLNDFNKINAVCVWTIDEGNNDPIVRLETNIHNIEVMAGRVISVEIQKNLLKAKSGDKYFIREKRDLDKISTFIYDKNDKTIQFKDLPKEIKEQLNSETFKSKKWEYDNPPFVFLENNTKQMSDAAYITNELEELVILYQKKRDDIFLSSVKVVEIGKGTTTKNKKERKNTSRDKAIKNRINYSGTSIVVQDNLSLEGTPKATIINGIPNTLHYDNAIRQIINTILKKTGGATDVDAKGSVQQSKSEILMSQGDEFKVAKWKLNNRQTKIKQLFSTIGEILLKNNQNEEFKDLDQIHVVISQEEVLSEQELIDNLIKARDAGFISDLIAYARYNQITLVDAYKLKNISFLENNE